MKDVFFFFFFFFFLLISVQQPGQVQKVTKVTTYCTQDSDMVDWWLDYPFWSDTVLSLMLT